MSKFHNPYHFVPLPAATSAPERYPLPNDEVALPGHATHDRFVTGLHSGRVLCQLTTITPLVIGAEQKGDSPKQVHPYFVPGTRIPDQPESGIPGIPGSALRGLISSILETATHSAFRVLEDRHFSFRKGMNEGLSALGIIVDFGEGLRLYPLADPHLELMARGNAGNAPIPKDFSLTDAIPKNSGNYSSIFADSLRKIYFGTPTSLRGATFCERFLSNNTATGGPFYALSKANVSYKIKRQLRGPNTFFYDLGDMTDAEPEPWDDLRHLETTHFRGVLRVLGVTSASRKKGMPTKKHEFFIPLCHNEEVTLVNGSATVIPILPEAVERFNQLADERTAETAKEPTSDMLPYTPNGQLRNKSVPTDTDRPLHAYHLKPGDVVFFRPTTGGDLVAEVSLSSIWRGRVEKGEEGARTAATLSDFIASANPDLLPVGDSRKKQLTPAELLFGYVEQKGSRALASRLRFLGATPIENQGELLHPDWIDLQILNSPKPPSPNLYFHKRQGSGSIRKSELSLEKHQIQGRKLYLHALKAAEAKSPTDPRWIMHQDNVESHDFDKMRVQVRPVLANKTFAFEIRFDNLTQFEIGALLYALCPSSDFRHKLGMGKPLGLGTVQITVREIELVDRINRYAKDALTDKRGERMILFGEGANEASKRPLQWVEEFKQVMKAADPDGATFRVLETLGDPAKVSHPLHYPQVAGPTSNNADFETERYEWFVTNDYKNTADNQRQHLGTVGAQIPSMDRLPKTHRGPGGGVPRPHNPGGHGPPAPQQRGPLGTLKVKCLGPARNGGWMFEGFHDGIKCFGYLDRTAQEPLGVRQGSEHWMTYTRSPQGTCFFRSVISTQSQ